MLSRLIAFSLRQRLMVEMMATSGGDGVVPARRLPVAG